MNLLIRILIAVYKFAKKHTKTACWIVFAVAVLMLLGLGAGKTYQHLDRDPDRGAVAIVNGAFSEDYDVPVYLDQGWQPSDSLWFYNTTQGSNLLPYDFFLVLERAESDDLLRSASVMDAYRYLPQKKTFFNPDALPVGFVKDGYKGMDYVGYTCAACHTGQVNYQGQAIRIDGGPAMADMVGFMTELEKALRNTLEQEDKRERFVEAVLAIDNDYDNAEQVLADLNVWANKRREYNLVNHSKVDYGYARLDAFGRIYNRVLQHVINKEQLAEVLLTARKPGGERMLTRDQVDKVLEGVDDTIVGNTKVSVIIERLVSSEDGYPGLGLRDVLRLRDLMFNEPNAPVSYPFLWDTAHSDYVQWNGIASNAGAGALGRNAGEVVGVFASLDWKSKKPWYSPLSISAKVSGQEKKKHVIDFESSVDLTNLQRLETQLMSLRSPQWPEHILGEIDRQKADRGQRLFAEYCQSCHEVVDPNNWDRKVIAQMSSLDIIQTDPAMAENSVFFKGKSGNFKHTYQEREGVGTILMGEEAPVALILSAAVGGVVATPDADKTWLRRQLDWLYIMGSSFFDNPIEASVKNGNYNPDTAANPFDSLLAYKARPLNGIWATAPYLHNGSVPSLYELLLPVKREGDPEEGEYRPDEFIVGSREFDPEKVGFISEGYDGFKFTADRRGNFNTGHEYAAGKTPRPDGRVLPPMTAEQRWDLVEYMKTL
jgi:hypothetical protein